MVAITREQKKELRKYLDIGYRRFYLNETDLWFIQVKIDPGMAFPYHDKAEVMAAFESFVAYRRGLIDGVNSTLSNFLSAIQQSLPRKQCELMITKIVCWIRKTIEKYLDDEGWQRMHVFTSDEMVVRGWRNYNKNGEKQVSKAMKSWTAACQAYPSKAREDLKNDPQYEAYITQIANSVADSIRKADDGNKRTSRALLDLAYEAAAEHLTERWRYADPSTRSNKGDEVTDDENNYYLYLIDDAGEDERQNIAKGESVPVSTALDIFIFAYRNGRLPMSS